MNMTTRNGARGEEGSMLIIVIIILALLTIIGISATDMGTTETKIAGNDKEYKIALFQAESGVYGAAKWARLAMDGGSVPLATDPTHRFTYPDAGNLADEVDGASTDVAKDLIFTMRNDTVQVDFQRGRTKQVVGGSQPGIGTGTSVTSVVQVPFWLASDTQTANGTQAGVTAQYLYMVGIPGGL